MWEGLVGVCPVGRIVDAASRQICIASHDDKLWYSPTRTMCVALRVPTTHRACSRVTIASYCPPGHKLRSATTPRPLMPHTPPLSLTRPPTPLSLFFFFLITRRPPSSPLFPSTPLSR